LKKERSVESARLIVGIDKFDCLNEASKDVITSGVTFVNSLLPRNNLNFSKSRRYAAIEFAANPLSI
jgi:hypothetical protein